MFEIGNTTTTFAGLVIIAALWIFQSITTRKAFKKISKLVQAVPKPNNLDTLKILGAIEYRLRRPTVDFEPSDSGNETWIVCFTLDRRVMLERTLRSIKHHEPRIRLLVVDNGSTDGTPQFLTQCLAQGLVDKIILNRRGDIPQWMKSFNLHQAFQLLSPERVDYLGWIDDDMEVHSPWKDLGIHLLQEFRKEGVRMITFHRDNIQDIHHPPLRSIIALGQEVAIKATVNGSFVFFDSATLKEFGLPPIREDINEMGVEDWFYSRILQGQGFYCASIDRAIHHGYTDSTRERVQADPA
ncbi:MAG: hypothetical protein H6Q00_2720 [Holophagaceae bacterium]|nr:hypothetical protein [Holophagaceae bacterium]